MHLQQAYVIIKYMENILKENNLKITLGRLEILRVLSIDNKPKTAEEIYKKMKKKYDLVTIYRNLELFNSKEIIFKENANKKDFYYLAKSQHHHIICRDCEKMECIPCSHKQFSINNFSQIKHQLLLTGICLKCSK